MALIDLLRSLGIIKTLIVFVAFLAVVILVITNGVNPIVENLIKAIGEGLVIGT